LVKVSERALELIRIAHPKFRQQLLDDVRKHYWVPEYQENTPTSVPELGEIELKRFTLGGESFTLRPLAPADERKLQEFFYSHTKETLMMRYNHHATRMSREKSCNLVSVDQHKDLALCFTQHNHLGESIQAVGRYYFLEKTNAAEVAFVIKENQRSKGMATALLLEIITIAKKRDLVKLVACVRRDNAPMLKVFENEGFIRNFSEELDEITLTLML